MTVEIDIFESWQWDDQFQEVRFQILDIDRLILCRISRGFIETYLKRSFANANFLDMVKEHINFITDLISLKAFWYSSSKISILCFKASCVNSSRWISWLRT